MLPLYGHAAAVRGFEPTSPRQVIRLRLPDAYPQSESDAALIREPSQAEAAAENGFSSAVLLGPSELANKPLPARCISLSTNFSYLADGDIIGFHPATKRFRTLYRRNSSHNSFLVTERCNHYCLMCSQPPKDIDDRWILREIREALPLVAKETHSLGFTGGEPLLEWEDFIATLSECRDRLPNTAVHVLSNGRAFADSKIANAWANVAHPDLMVGIPIYSSVDTLHNHVVQAQGAFDETLLGILKLKDKGQRVEVRVVLHALTAPRIVETSRWLARNLPFVDHIALMGLENTGFAIANDAMLWVDPIDYRSQLAEAVDILDSARMQVSVYNLTRCVLAPSVWPFAAQSISDWKNDYLPACNSCIEKSRCSGFFATGRPRYSRGISPISH